MERYGTGPNTTIHLMYRDASNYKAATEFTVTGSFDTADADRVAAALDHKTWLIVPQFAAHLGAEVPDPRERMLERYSLNDDDRCWVELVALEGTAAAPSVPCTTSEVLAAFEACAEQGWNDVDPYG